MKILVTGGAGYIGSHTVLSLLKAGHVPVVVDDFSNSKPEAIHRVEALAGKRVELVEMDVASSHLDDLFSKHSFDAVIHFAGLKAVGESVRLPLKYYGVNLGSTINLLKCMQKAGCRNLVFSSSATVYGDPEKLPLTEDCRLSAESPYGRTKLIIEDILRDLVKSEPKANWHIALLRYFNPVGAHESGRIGEDPNGIPNNLFPFVTQVAIGRLPKLSVYGNDYPTPDGTGVRDYLHVMDLAQGHVAAVEKIHLLSGAEPINLGTGRGNSVLEVIKAFEAASGRSVPYQIVARRPGDVASCYADASKAKRLLGWEAQRDLLTMCQDSWRWQQQNPKGYEAKSS
jgi:UDP-glucose 4-epimerase